MEVKGSHYKLDFKYKYNKKNYNAADCTLYQYGYSFGNGLLSAIHHTYIREDQRNEYWSKMQDTDIPEHYTTNEHNIEVRDMFLDFIKSGKDITDYKAPNHRYYELRDLHNTVAKQIAKRTPVYQEVVTNFNSWLKTRPGVVEVYSEYRKYHNSRVHDEDRQLPENIQFEIFGDISSTRKFKMMLENQRPLKFSTGDVVILKAEYRNKRGKDPFYYIYDQNITKMDRVGTVLKKIGTNHSYGVGSREIRVLWFGTGQETCVMEKCLREFVTEPEPDAANSV